VVKAFAKYRPVDAAVWRVSAFASIPAAGWPGRDASSPQWRVWLAQVWASPGFAEAITHASAVLAEQVVAVVEGTAGDDRRASRVGHAVARYLARIRSRVTPFGLFAGVAPLRFGAVATTGGSEPGDRLRLRANGAWVAAVIAALESEPALVRCLTVAANDLVTVRGGRLHVEWQPHGGDPSRRGPVEVSVRHTPPVAAALAAARRPIAVSELEQQLLDRFPATGSPVVARLIGQLVTAGALITQLRPPSTQTDPLRHVLYVLDSADLAAAPAAQVMRDRLRAVHAMLAQDAPSDDRARSQLATRMRATAPGTDRPLGIDLRPAEPPPVSGRIATETATAVELLLQVSKAPAGRPGWREYRDRFRQRYGTGALVPVTDLIDPAVGLGYPRHFADPAFPGGAPWSGRDEHLLQLVQQAALDGTTEVHLSTADIAALAVSGATPGNGRYGPAHLDVTVEVRAACTAAVDRGEFTLAVLGAGRSIAATSGRFLDLLPGHVDLLSDAVATIVDGATLAQLSFPPYRPATESVTRVPQLFPTVISVGEHRPAAEQVLRLEDLAVTADLDRLYVVDLPSRRIIEPVVACAAAPHTMPPVVRLLMEIPRATGVALSLFDWGAAARLPFLPRLRHGRIILSPARWRIPTGALPGPQASAQRWEAAFGELRQRLRLPEVVAVGSGDQQLRLAVDDPMDQALLRGNLDKAGGPVEVTEAARPHEFGWCAGRAHEIVVPLVRIGRGVQPAIARRLAGRPVVPVEHGQLPGGGVVFGKLYGPPDLFSSIITEHLPDLINGENDAGRWWFVRYRDPHPHLRLRLVTDDFGRDAARLGRWAAQLRRLRLAGDLVLDTYRPETARYGTGPAMVAAEQLFTADSAAAIAQLTTYQGTPDSGDAITAVSHLDLLAALLGDSGQAIGWLLDHPDLLPRPTGDSRTARRHAIALAAPLDTGEAVAGAGTIGAPLAAAWAQRRTAARAYARQLADDPAGPSAAEVAMSLLHLHHNRAVGIDPDSEARIYHLARAVALAATHRGTVTAGSRA
jgi:thiopeptide-type bacteriocin biosynthesis protein